MTISDTFARVPLGQIKVLRDRRQRRDVDTKGLLESIKLRGVLSPIIIDQDYQLVFGERRLTASRELGLPDIPVRFVSGLSPVELQILELEENAKRSDLVWQDTIRAVANIHALHLASDPGWTMGETGESIGFLQGTISMYLRVNAEMEDDKISQASTVREAYNVITRRDQRSSGDALAELLEVSDEILDASRRREAELELGLPAADLPVQLAENGTPIPSAPRPIMRAAPIEPERPKGSYYPPVEESIILESFLHWAPKYSGKKFNLIHCDFPYGVNLFAGPQSGRDRAPDQVYGDGKDVYFDLLICLCENLDRLMAVSGHLMFWYSETHGDETRRIFRELAPTLAFQKFPLIWTKTDNAGISSDASRNPRHVYETCLLASRGGRNIVKIAADWYGSPTDKRLHISTKPEPMLKHFMSMLVDSNTRMLDPTCGSASSLRAAEELGCVNTLGMDIDDQSVGVARVALKNARGLRLVSRSL